MTSWRVIGWTLTFKCNSVEKLYRNTGFHFAAIHLLSSQYAVYLMKDESANTLHFGIVSRDELLVTIFTTGLKTYDKGGGQGPKSFSSDRE